MNGHTFFGGYYVWKGLRYVPSWGGSMFEALMPLLVLDEPRLAPASLGRNAWVHTRSNAASPWSIWAIRFGACRPARSRTVAVTANTGFACWGRVAMWPAR